MTKEELRIGNWILNEKNQKVIVNWINGNIEEISYPIQLTEEIILMCGFEFNSDFSLGKYPFEIQRSNLNGDVFLFYIKGSFGVEIKYIHQLQNLYFSLTGEELKVNL